MLYPHLVSQAREKDSEILDSHYRRDFISLDNQLLNGEMFLQVGIYTFTRNYYKKSSRLELLSYPIFI